MSELWARNYAAIMHELETPWRGHDADGACCQTAVVVCSAECRSGETCILPIGHDGEHYTTRGSSAWMWRND